MRYDSFLKWRHITSYAKNPLYFYEKYPREQWRHRMPYASHKIHPLLKFIEKDEVFVNLLHNNNKSACHKLQKFQEIPTCQGVFDPVHAFTDHLQLL